MILIGRGERQEETKSAVFLVRGKEKSEVTACDLTLSGKQVECFEEVAKLGIIQGRRGRAERERS